jgi:hypothetical protein
MEGYNLTFITPPHYVERGEKRREAKNFPVLITRARV